MEIWDFSVIMSDPYRMTFMTEYNYLRDTGATHFDPIAKDFHFYLNSICELREKIASCYISLLIWKCVCECFS